MKTDNRVMRQYRVILTVLLTAGLIFITYTYHVRRNIDVVITHLFYIPVVLAAFWWRFKGLVVSVILILFLIFSHFIFETETSLVSDSLRAAILMAVAVITAFSSHVINSMGKVERQINQELNQIFNKSSNGMLVVDRDYNIIQANDSFFNMFKLERRSLFNRDEFQKIKCFEMNANQYCDSSNCPSRKIFEGADFAERDIELKDARGNEVYCIVAASPFRRDERGVSSVILDFKNITERKENERKFAQYGRQLRMMASELSLAEERERKRLATDLHDSVSQTLFVAKMQLGALMKEAGDLQRDDRLDDVYKNIEKALSETRSLIFEISPPILYEIGLEGAIEWLCERIHERHGIKCQVDCDMKKRWIDQDVKVLLFQVVRELLNNVVKHSRASLVKVMLRGGEQYVRCVVEDNGIGFDVKSLGERADGNAGFGLFNMRERLNHFEGNLILESVVGSGTKVTIIAPYESCARKA